MKNLMSNKIFKAIFWAVDFIIIWTLIDWIISLIGHKPFEFSAVSHLVEPAVAGVVVSLLEPFSAKWGKKDEKDKKDK